MSALLFCWLASPLWLIAEILMGNLAVFLPFSGYCVLYFGTTTSLKNAAALALFLGLTQDSLYGRNFPVATVLLFLALALRRQHFPGAAGKSGLLAATLAGTVFSLAVGIAEVVALPVNERWNALMVFPVGMFLGILFFFLFAVLMDRIALRIGAPVYFFEETNDTPTRRVRIVSQKTVGSDRRIKNDPR